MLELPPDVSFYVQIVLFLAFAAILRTLILEPTQRLLSERQRRTEGVLLEADQARADVEQIRQDLEKRLAEARHQGLVAGDQLRREADASEQALLAAARADATRTLDDVRARITAETSEARTRLGSDARDLAREASSRILGRAVAA